MGATTRRASSRAQPAEVALIAPLLVAVAILLQPWIVLSQPSEQSLLYDFYSSTSGWPTRCSGGWSTNTTPLCSGGSTTWYGVGCNAGSVVQIILAGCGIRGTLPPRWSNQPNSLPNLQQLFLYNNSLHGTLPSQWGDMTSMLYLYLYNNSLSGTLPWQWSSLTNMRTLYLHNNSLSGTLPPQWGALPSALDCRVNGNCLNTANAAAWWLNSTYRNIGGQRTTGCVAPSASRGASLSLSNTRSDSMTGSRGSTVVFSTSSILSATNSFPIGSYVSSLSVSISISENCNATITERVGSIQVTVSESPPHVIDQPVLDVASRVAAVARTVAIATAVAPMLAGAGIASMGCSAVQLSVASSLLANRRREPSSIDGIGESLLENPLQLKLPSLPLSLQMTGGAVVGNAVVCLIVIVCAALVSHVLEGGQRRCDVICVWRSFRAYFVERLPGALLAPVGLLLQPTLASSLALMVSPHRTAGSCALGAVGLVAIVGGLVWTTVAVRVGLLNRRVSCTTNLVALLPSGIGCCHTAARCHWAPLTASHDDRVFFLRFGPFFSDTMNNRSMYFAFDLWSTVAAALISAIGLSLDDAAVALPASGVLCGIAVVRLVAVVGLRPHSVSPSNVFAALLEALSAAATVLGCIDSGDAGVEASLWLSVVQTLSIGLSGLADCIIRVCVACRAYFATPADARKLGPPFFKSRAGFIGSNEAQPNRALRELVSRICSQQIIKKRPIEGSSEADSSSFSFHLR